MTDVAAVPMALLLSSSDSNKFRSSNWFETPTLSLGQRAGVAQLEPGSDGKGGLRFGWKRVNQDRSGKDFRSNLYQ